jgi:outer membrane protein assembly factor BamB
MSRACIFFSVLLASVIANKGIAAAQGSGLIPATAAARHGLTSAWYAQVEVDAGRGRIASMILDEGTLFVVTDRGMVQAIDAQSGATLWAERVGSPRHPTLPPDANSHAVGVVNGSSLYVLNRHTGRMLLQTTVEGAPAGGVAMSSRRAFVPSADGTVYAYYLEQARDPPELEALPSAAATAEVSAAAEGSPAAPAAPSPEVVAAEKSRQQAGFRLVRELNPPLACPGVGSAWVAPLVTRENPVEEYVVWSTDEKMVFMGQVSGVDPGRFTMQYRLTTRGEIAGQPAYLLLEAEHPTSGMVFVGSLDGYVHALQEMGGESLWRYSTGAPIREAVVAVDRRVYAINQLGGMTCLSAPNGALLWTAPNVTQFLAASKERVYAIDRLHRLVALDVRSGGQVAAMPLRNVPLRLVNMQTDRIYLANDYGLIQCLHESGLRQPIDHVVRPKVQIAPPTAPAGAAATAPPAAEATPDEAVAPAEPVDAAPTAPDPFGDAP